MTWDPGRYREFRDHRLRPGLDLMARIGGDPALIYDLGCGTGELTAILAERYPQARVVGVDNSSEMLAQAHPRPNLELQLAAIEEFDPNEPVDVIYSNATLHWIGDHERLFPRLLSHLSEGGVLAVQMPDNWAAPTHQLINTVIDSMRFVVDRPISPLGRPEQYLDWLSPATEIDLWRTTYFQVLRGEDPVVNWVEGSILGPVRAALDSADYARFRNELAAGYRKAYPPRSDGTTVLPFSRLFLVARR